MQHTRVRDWESLERHALECIAEAEKLHTPEEIQAAELALSSASGAPQRSLFAAPPNAGLIPGGQPESPGLADCSSCGDQE